MQWVWVVGWVGGSAAGVCAKMFFATVLVRATSKAIPVFHQQETVQEVVARPQRGYDEAVLWQYYTY